ncbi:helix-hairpin-helix domain-containing protein [Candidatus Thorarchaeota archaeon]|nr:MAG: helix-hairpin-helix domain-containing protein [Candidatus Thorarchaeota archaeon]
MLEYREFPYRTAITFLLFSVPLAQFVFVILGLLSGTLFEMTLLEHQGLLGLGALAAVFTLPTIGVIADRVKKLDPLLYLFTIAPAIIGILSMLPSLNPYLADLNLALVISSFVGISALFVLWILRLGQSIVVRYRGRTTALFLTIAILLQLIYSQLDVSAFIGSSYGAIFPSIVSLVVILVSAGLKPWKQPRVSLTVSGNSMRYFIPTIFILASHLLWYSVTKLSIQEFFAIFDPSFVSLSQYLGLEVLEIIIVCVGIIIAGLMADTRGRKTTFSFVLLLMGLLTIFGSAFYNGFFLEPSLTVLLTGLLISERFIEGFLLGICLLLIWPELGSVRTKGLRLSLVWFFFLGYMTLFWALDLNATVFGIVFDVPAIVVAIGGQFAILSALIALYLIGPLPEILGREIEVEELALDFDEKQVKSTVAAFVGSDDFDSIRSQIDIMDAGAEISDSDMNEILGEEFRDMLPLRSVPGIGNALEKKLIDAGYESAAQLAGETAQRLSQKIEGLTLARAEKILKDARSVVKKKMKKNNK